MITDRDRNLLRWLEVNHAISVKQADTIFFKNYKSAARRLAQLEEQGTLKSYNNKLTGEKVYYYDIKLTPHDLFKHEFYKKIVEHGGEVTRFDREPKYLNDLMKSDGYFEFKWNGPTYCVILEVDYTHMTDIDKFSLYNKLYEDGTMGKLYGVDPMLVVLRENLTTRYMPEHVPVIYLDFGMRLFKDLVLL